MRRLEPKEPEGFWRRTGRKLHHTLLRFRGFFEKYPWLMFVYKTVIAVIGTIIILAGIAMLVLPGPGWVTIFFGLAVLGTEFVWARKSVLWLRNKLVALYDRWRRYRQERKKKRSEE